MSDREALAAALEYWDDPIDRPELDPAERLIFAAARERLAQLPEKCEHGESKYHLIDGLIVNGSCPGKVYPVELVERIALALYAFDGYPVEEWVNESVRHTRMREMATAAAAVLAALDSQSSGETL